MTGKAQNWMTREPRFNKLLAEAPRRMSSWWWHGLSGANISQTIWEYWHCIIPKGTYNWSIRNSSQFYQIKRKSVSKTWWTSSRGEASKFYRSHPQRPNPFRIRYWVCTIGNSSKSEIILFHYIWRFCLRERLLDMVTKFILW